MQEILQIKNITLGNSMPWLHNLFGFEDYYILGYNAL
jgi:hypothetical protein